MALEVLVHALIKAVFVNFVALSKDYGYNAYFITKN